MSHLHPIPILGAAVAAFVFAAAYYSLLAGARSALSPAAARTARPPLWVMPVEFVKALVLAAFIALLVDLGGVATLPSALGLALGLWLAFPVILLAGSIMHESVPVKLAAIHAGDWLAKLIVITAIVVVWG